jgi:hypothetical protein
MDNRKIADDLEAEYLAVANGIKKPAKIALEPMVRAVEALRATPIPLADAAIAEREAFEAWALGEFELAALPTRQGEGYRLSGVDDSWAGWQRRAALAIHEAAPVEMALCSTEQVFLKPNQLYRFYVKDGCKACARIADPSAHTTEATMTEQNRVIETRLAMCAAKHPEILEAPMTDAIAPTEGERPAWRAHEAAIDTQALSTAQEIALMWGRDRSQFVSRIQVAVTEAMKWLYASVPECAPSPSPCNIEELAADLLRMIEKLDMIPQHADIVRRAVAELTRSNV